MIRKTALVAGLLMLGALAGPQTSSAAPLLPASGSSIAADTSLVEKTHWRRRHRHWRHWRHCRWHWSEWRGWHRHCHWHHRHW
jgi:hypothetical protein